MKHIRFSALIFYPLKLHSCMCALANDATLILLHFSSSTCNTSSTWNGSNTLQCQKGVISWNNPRENKTIVFEQGGKPFNLCLTFRPFPFSNMSTFSVSTVRNREYGITIIYHPDQRSCFESYCGRVILMLSTGKEKEIDVIEEPRRISLEFSTTILQRESVTGT